MKILSVDSLAYSAKDGHRLCVNISFEVNGGDLVFVKGPNGVGKTTLLKTILGSHPSDEGSVDWHIPLDTVAVLPQLQNDHFHLPLTLEDVLGETGIQHSLLKNIALDTPWLKASGGERMKTLLVRKLVKKPSLLILDEPSNHLDNNAISDLCTVLQDYMNENNGRSILMITHDRSVEQNLCSTHRQIKKIELEKIS